MCVCVCMCVCEREREREREWKGRETYRLWYIPLESLWFWQWSLDRSLAVSVRQVASAVLQVTAVLQEVSYDWSIGPSVLSIHTKLEGSKQECYYLSKLTAKL